MNQETAQICAAILQNKITLDLLTAAQGGVCAIIETNCCVYIPDYKTNVSPLMEDMQHHISQIDSLREDPVATWLSNMSWNIKVSVIVVAGLLLFCIFISFAVLSGVLECYSYTSGNDDLLPITADFEAKLWE